jgi:hypothetical protein
VYGNQLKKLLPKGKKYSILEAIFKKYGYAKRSPDDLTRILSPKK